MIIDRRTALLGALSATMAGEAAAQTAPPVVSGKSLPPGLPQPHETIDLWPTGAPGMPAKPPTERVEERSTDSALNDRAVFGITRPRLAVFRPQIPNGAAIMIAPGGGYARVVVDKEGYELARWFTARGVTAFVLFYRLPGDGWAAGPDVALVRCAAGDAADPVAGARLRDPTRSGRGNGLLRRRPSVRRSRHALRCVDLSGGRCCRYAFRAADRRRADLSGHVDARADRPCRLARIAGRQECLSRAGGCAFAQSPRPAEQPALLPCRSRG